MTLPGAVRTADAVRAAAEHGKICALAARAQRDLQGCADRHPELFAARPFDGALFGTVSLANAFGSPDDSAAQIEIANRTSLWIFALDWLVDYKARSRAEVEEVLAGCRAVGDGGDPVPGRPLTAFLAEIRDRLAEAPGFAELRPVWRDELERMLRSMALEWEWKSAGAAGRPTFEEYLDNADNFGSTWVNIAHWISTGGPSWTDHLDDLRAASREVQRVLRLLNDLATYERDVEWGDLNALLLGTGREAVTERIAVLVERCRELIGALHGPCPREAVYLERQIGYSIGFYGATDYWGAL
ncbi:terpene synthase family protein [Spirillospora sp. NPDC029432]|uniref:terpene synthase family protein n=1 Tax=Spirillospora sp. NPDC029432 TaxID=3154599 RepID=UPI003452CC3A